MASNQCIAFAIVAIVLPTLAMAVDHVVGDAAGWNPNFNYTAWASGKVFHVGDRLVFNYPVSKHDVYKVNGTGFKDCLPSGEPLTSGNDIINITGPGRKWYICGIANHCSLGQKLVIDVEDAAPTPAPNAAHGIASNWVQIVLAAMVVVVVLVSI